MENTTINSSRANAIGVGKKIGNLISQKLFDEVAVTDIYRPDYFVSSSTGRICFDSQSEIFIVCPGNAF